MSEERKINDSVDRATVEWPPALCEEPDYPELALREIDLASDTIGAALTAGAHLRLVKG